MSKDHTKKTASLSMVLTSAIAAVLVLPLVLMSGILLGLIEDFGLRHTVGSIRLNPGMFADQYAWLIVVVGWVAVVDLIGLAMIAGVMLIRRYGKPPTPEERQSRPTHEQPGG